MDIEEQELINKNERNTIANVLESEDNYDQYSEILLNKPIKCHQVKKRMKKVF